jgi:hypothetical protein
VSTIEKELRMGAATGFMKLRTLVATLVFYALMGLFAHNEVSAQGTAAIHSGMPVLNSSPPSSSSSSQAPGEQKALHKKCAEAGERLEHDVAAMVPGRRWTCQLDSERSRERLDELQRDLTAFREADIAFEESLSPGQRLRFNSHMTATRELFQHLERDARSLDDELRKGYPTRWHVANDVSDMRKEINRWRKLHQRLAEDLGMRH